MKKLKIRGYELKRIGYTDDQAISLALNLIRGYIHGGERPDKVSLLELLEKIKLRPGLYVNDAFFGELAKKLIHKAEPIRKDKVAVKKSSVGFKIFGEEIIDPEAIQQMKTAMSLPVSVTGALMADAHVGYGLPIGGVLATYNAVIPYGVGLDIGCRMCLSVYSLPPAIIDQQRDRIRKILMSETRFGVAEFNDLEEYEILERKEFKEIRFLKTLQQKFADQLGSSGHGNHFVDVGEIEIKDYSSLIGLQPGRYFAVLSHSGSRNFGAEVCRHYTELAQRKLGLKGETGRLAWLDLDSEEGLEYWAAMQLAGDYSHTNHRIIHQRLAQVLGEKPLTILENHHNFAWKERLSEGEDLIIHRKGATPTRIGDIGIIPGTMASPAFIVSGKGNEESLCSAAHGAGRLVSRHKARKNYSESQLRSFLKEQGIELIGGGADETPFAYKDIFQVMKQQKDLVDVLGLFYPRIVRME